MSREANLSGHDDQREPIPTALNRSRRSAEQVQRVRRIVHVVESLVTANQPEQGTGSRRIAAVVEQHLRDLMSGRCRFHDKAITAVRGKDIAICHDCESQRIIQRAA